MPIPFEQDANIDVVGLRALTPHASADSLAGSPVRQRQRPGRHTAAGEKPGWDASTRWSSAAVQQRGSVAVQQRGSVAVQQCSSAAVRQCGSAAAWQCSSAAAW